MEITLKGLANEMCEEKKDGKDALRVLSLVTLGWDRLMKESGEIKSSVEDVLSLPDL